MIKNSEFRSFNEFWPFYLSQHAQPGTRVVHFFGTGLAGLMLVEFAITGSEWWLPAALLCGYGPAWLSHMLIEKNRPATFRYPLWSLVGDLRMFLYTCTGRLTAELDRHKIAPR